MNLGALEAYCELKDKFSEGFEKFERACEGAEHTFEKLTSGVEAGSKVMGGAILAIAAGVVGMTAAVVELGVHGAEVDDIAESFENLAGGADKAEGILEKLRSATVGTISDFDLMKTTNTALSQQLDLTNADFEKLGQGAMVLANRTGGTIAEGYQQMIQAMVSGRTRALEMAGAQIDLSRSTVDYANSIGKGTSELTKHEQQASRTKAVLESVNGLLKQSGVPTADFANNIERLQVKWENFINSFARAVATSEVVQAALNDVSKAIDETFGDSNAQKIATMTEKVNAFVIDLSYVVQGFDYVKSGLTMAYDALKIAVYDGLGYIIEGFNRYNTALDNYLVTPTLNAVAKISRGLSGAASFVGADDLSDKLLQGANTMDIVAAKTGKASGEATKFLDAMSKSLHGEADEAANAAKKEAEAFETRNLAAEDWRRKMEKLGQPKAAFVGPPDPTGAGGGGKKKKDGAVDPFGANFLQGLIAAESQMSHMLGLVGASKLAAKDFTDQFGGGLEDIAKKAQLLGVELPKGIQEALDKSREFKFGEMVQKDVTQANSMYKDFSEKRRQLDLTGEAARLDGIEHERSSAIESFEAMKTSAIKAYADMHAGAEPPPELVQDWEATGDAIEDYFDQLKLGDSLGKSLSKALESMPQTIMGALQGGGNLLKSVGGSIFGSIFGKDSAITHGISAFSKTLGAMVPGLGAIAGSVLGGLGDKIFGSIFGGGEKKQVAASLKQFTDGEGGVGQLKLRADAAGVSLDKLFNATKVKDFDAALKDVNEQLALGEARNSFEKEEGGLAALKRKAEEAGVSLDATFNAKNVKEFDYAMNKVKDDLAFNDQAAQKLDAAIQKYGFSIEELGPKFKSQRLVEEGMAVYEEFKLLQGAGIDTGTILNKMMHGDGKGGKQTDLAKFVDDAMKAGTAIPKAMKPMIDAMAESGQLIDGNGKKFKSAEDAGITFSETLDEKFGDLLDTIQKLVDAITGVSHATNGIDKGKFTTAPAGYQAGPPTGTDTHGHGFAGGSHGLVNFGRETWVPLHGREAVLTEPQFMGLTSHAAARTATAASVSVTHAGNVINISVDGSTDVRGTVRAIRDGLKDVAGADAAGLKTEIQKVVRDMGRA